MSLATIAQNMRRQLVDVERGYVSRTLFGGLVIVYERRGATWRLAIGREASPPSKTEAVTVARSFGAPVGIEWSWTTKKRKPRGAWHVAECTWIERGSEHENDSDSE